MAPSKENWKKWVSIGCTLVVTGALFMLLWPVYASARVAARSVNSKSNLKDLGTAALLYSQENDDRFPIAKNWEFTLFGDQDIDDILTDPLAPSNFKRGYAMNQAMGSVITSEVHTPSRQVLFFTSMIDEVSAVGGKADLRWGFVCTSDGNVAGVNLESADQFHWDLRREQRSATLAE